MWPAGPFGAPMWHPIFMPPFFVPLQPATGVPYKLDAWRTPERVTRESSPQDSEEEDNISLCKKPSSPTCTKWHAWFVGPPDLILAFLTKNFNRVLSDEDKEAILQEYPKPNCSAMEVPCLDDNVKEQLKRKGMDPKFGAEKNMFWTQEQSLEIGGPLTCLLANLVNPEVEVDREAIIQVVQRALVLLESVSHSISLERRKVAWASAPQILSTRGLSGSTESTFCTRLCLELDKAFAKVTSSTP